MHELTYQNWLRWSVNRCVFADRSSPFEPFTLGWTYEPPRSSPPSFVWALEDATRKLVDPTLSYPTRDYTVFCSGGMDSEIALRELHRVVPDRLTAVTLQFTDGSNREDVASAKALCAELGVRQTIIDHDVQEFAASKRLTQLSQLYQCSQMAYLAVLSYASRCTTDTTVVMGGEIMVQKQWNNEGVPSWYYVYREDEDASTYRFSLRTHIRLVNEYFSYTPELWASYVYSPQVKAVFANPHKLSLVSSKNSILRELYFKPLGIEPKATVKRHGYERNLGLVLTVQNRLRRELMPMQTARVLVEGRGS